jgi:hypothetical protein
MTVEIKRRRFDVHDYYRMAKAGILHEDDRVELIEGEILEMAPIGSRHMGCVDRLNWLLSQQLIPAETIVHIQGPVRLSTDSEPQPDLAVLRYRDDFYTLRHPGADEVFLLVEVADSSLDYDTEVKVPLYARAGIPEVWVIDLNARAIEVYRKPSAEGYALQFRPGPDDLLVVEALPRLIIRPRELFID